MPIIYIYFFWLKSPENVPNLDFMIGSLYCYTLAFIYLHCMICLDILLSCLFSISVLSLQCIWIYKWIISAEAK